MALTYSTWASFKVVKFEDLASATSTTALDMQSVDGAGFNYADYLIRQQRTSSVKVAQAPFSFSIYAMLTAVAAAVPVITVIAEASLDNVTFEQCTTAAITLPTATAPIATSTMSVMQGFATGFLGAGAAHWRYLRLRASAWTSGTLRTFAAFPLTVFDNSWL